MGAQYSSWTLKYRALLRGPGQPSAANVMLDEALHDVCEGSGGAESRSGTPFCFWHVARIALAPITSRRYSITATI